ncbi:hypothetical protein [Aquimarina aggregata]|uniref:hypothetical protein n=1 Tax=Aquimarina aggregata TaxID=1642818 RepID=UPI0024916556|nr:hypothetical protein [Aquimarina aggregata]
MKILLRFLKFFVILAFLIVPIILIFVFNYEPENVLMLTLLVLSIFANFYSPKKFEDINEDSTSILNINRKKFQPLFIDKYWGISYTILAKPIYKDGILKEICFKPNMLSGLLGIRIDCVDFDNDEKWLIIEISQSFVSKSKDTKLNIAIDECTCPIPFEIFMQRRLLGGILIDKDIRSFNLKEFDKDELIRILNVSGRICNFDCLHD